MRRRQVGCASATTFLPLLVDEDARVDPAVVRHVAVCLRCQAELAGYRRVRRHLTDLRSAALSPPPGAVVATLDALGPAQRGRAYLAAVVGGAVGVAGMAAGVTGMVVRHHRRRPLAG